eukprot:scaffold8407_cov19-Tisochrysis_lutea.AAC.2
MVEGCMQRRPKAGNNKTAHTQATARRAILSSFGCLLLTSNHARRSQAALGASLLIAQAGASAKIFLKCSANLFKCRRSQAALGASLLKAPGGGSATALGHLGPGFDDEGMMDALQPQWVFQAMALMMEVCSHGFIDDGGSATAEAFRPYDGGSAATVSPSGHGFDVEAWLPARPPSLTYPITSFSRLAHHKSNQASVFPAVCHANRDHCDYFSAPSHHFCTICMGQHHALPSDT